jgi:hypothetical protein
VTLETQRRWRLFVGCAGLFLCANARRASAHDPFEVTTTASVGAESMTLVATMTRASAALVSRLETDGKAFSADRFARHDPQLRAAARSL